MTVPARWLFLALSAASLAACSAPSDGGRNNAPESKTAAVAGPGDVEAGRRAFGQCRSCHAIEPDVIRVGPSLFGVVGRPAGAVEGYSYSKAMADSGLTWTPDALDAYLENPHKVIKGTKMSLAGIPDAQRRADIIAYVETLK